MVLGRAAVAPVRRCRLDARASPVREAPVRAILVVSAAPYTAAELQVPWLASNFHVHKRKRSQYELVSPIGANLLGANATLTPAPGDARCG